MKNWVEVEGDLALREREGRLGVLKLEMSLRREEEDRWGNGEGHGGSSPSIDN